jgi:hypothetical protein
MLCKTGLLMWRTESKRALFATGLCGSENRYENTLRHISGNMVRYHLLGY